jgi:hypothetical protein
MNRPSRIRSVFHWQGPRRGEGAEYVSCRLCRRPYRVITLTHLRHRHRVGVLEYRRKFPDAPVTCLEIRERESISQARRNKALGRHWSRKQVVRAIRARVAAGRYLNLGAVRAGDGSLLEAGLRYFRSWDNALRAARIDPERVRKWTRWSRERMLERILGLKREDVPLSWAAARRRDPKLLKAAVALFGSWTKALQALGHTPVYEHVGWTKAEVVRRILERRKRGEPLYARSLMVNGQGKLYGAARAKFGTWGKALQAAGIDPQTVHLRRDWTRENVLSAIRKACRRRNAFGMEDEDPGLVRAARKFYGGWHEALGAAGVWSPGNRAGYRWTRKELLSATRRRARLGRPMGPGDVRKEANDLYMAGRKRFGSWRAVARAAGCSRAVPPPRRAWPREELIRLLKRLGRKGHLLRRNLNQVKRPGFGTPAASIRRIWGTFRAAKRIAGVV